MFARVFNSLDNVCTQFVKSINVFTHKISELLILALTKKCERYLGIMCIINQHLRQVFTIIKIYFFYHTSPFFFHNHIILPISCYHLLHHVFHIIGLLLYIMPLHQLLFSHLHLLLLSFNQVFLFHVHDFLQRHLFQYFPFYLFHIITYM